MESTCVLDVLPIIPNWKVYNLPTKKKVQYCLISKQRKDIQSLFENDLCQQHGRKKSCFILDKRLNSKDTNKSIDIIFLNKERNVFFLSLKLLVCEKHVLRRCNNLLVFFKNCKKEIKYHIQKETILIKCDTQIQWELFYCLFRFLLKIHETTVIGAAFYCSLISKQLILNERNCLLFINNRIMHRKPLYQNPINTEWIEEFKDVINDQLMTKMEHSLAKNGFTKACVFLSGKELYLESPHSKLKRQTPDDVSVKNCFPNKKTCKTNSCTETVCNPEEWKVFRNFKKCKINRYMDILLNKGILNDIEMPSQEENCDLLKETSLVAKFCDTFNNEKLHLSKEKKSSRYVPNVNLDSPKCSNIVQGIPCSAKYLNEFPNIAKENSISIPKNISSKNECSEKTFENFEKAASRFDSSSGPALKNPNPALSSSSKEGVYSFFNEFLEDRNSGIPELGTFQTAAGKKVHISQSALKAAQRMLAEDIQLDEEKESECKDLTKQPAKIPKFENKCINQTAMGLKSKAEVVASRKNLDSQDYAGDTIDGALADKMFQEISFDEKELDDCFAPSSLVARNDKSVSCGKVRKSLGGRRSLKPYSAVKPF